jgi:hypothetical protein
MKLNETETEIHGEWEFREGRMIANEVCRRIEYLKQEILEKIGTDPSGWDTLYRDPQDGRLWELVYLHGEIEGGGPPSLLHLSVETARAKYGFG